MSNPTPEIVQLVDVNGNFVRAVERSDTAYGDGEHMLVAELVLFTPDGDVVFHKRGFSTSEPLTIDHVCGAVIEGETPEEAAIRESRQEVELMYPPRNITRVLEGVNCYSRYRILLRGFVDEVPVRTRENADACFVGAASLAALEGMRSRGSVFVGGFFESIHNARRLRV